MTITPEMTPAQAATVQMIQRQATRISALPFDQHDAEFRRVRASIEYAIIQNGFSIDEPDKAEFIETTIKGLQALVGRMMIGGTA